MLLNNSPCARLFQTSPRALGQAFIFPTPTLLPPSSPTRLRPPSPRSPEHLGVNVGQRIRRLSGEERGEGDGQEETGGETRGGERREERRRQAQMLQIHRELQNVEVSSSTFFLLFFFLLSHRFISVKTNVTQ